MHRIITGGTGLVGKQLTEYWLSQNHPIIVVGRSPQQIKQLFGTRVKAVTWDELNTDLLKTAEVIVNLAGENVGTKRWSVARKQEIVNSRINTTKRIVDLLSQLGKESPPLFNASAFSIYGLQQQNPNELPLRLDENTTIDWDHPPDFLSMLARRWETTVKPAIEQSIRVVFLRFGIILAKEGGALPEIVRPFYFYLGGPLGTGNQPFSWITIDDTIRAIDFLVSDPKASGPYNIVAPECVMLKQVTHAIGEVLHRPSAMRMPSWMVKLMLGTDMAHELLLEGQHVYPKRLLDLGFQFRYPKIKPALEHLLK